MINLFIIGLAAVPITVGVTYYYYHYHYRHHDYYHYTKCKKTSEISTPQNANRHHLTNKLKNPFLPLTNHYDVIIVGSDLRALATAVSLARYSCYRRILIVEGGEYLGGPTGYFQADAQSQQHETDLRPMGKSFVADLERLCLPRFLPKIYKLRNNHCTVIYGEEKRRKWGPITGRHNFLQAILQFLTIDEALHYFDALEAYEPSSSLFLQSMSPAPAKYASIRSVLVKDMGLSQEKCSLLLGFGETFLSSFALHAARVTDNMNDSFVPIDGPASLVRGLVNTFLNCSEPGSTFITGAKVDSVQQQGAFTGCANGVVIRTKGCEKAFRVSSSSVITFPPPSQTVETTSLPRRCLTTPGNQHILSSILVEFQSSVSMDGATTVLFRHANTDESTLVTSTSMKRAGTSMGRHRATVVSTASTMPREVLLEYFCKVFRGQEFKITNVTFLSPASGGCRLLMGHVPATSVQLSSTDKGFLVFDDLRIQQVNDLRAGVMVACSLLSLGQLCYTEMRFASYLLS
jgi:hypothetical protein